MPDSVPDSDHEGPVSAIAPTLAIDAGHEYAGFRRTRTDVVDASSESGPPSGGRLPDVGDTVGHYVLVQKLGEGAHGAVYRAHRVGLEEHRVALKIIPCTKERLPLVRQELVTLATVVHPNIVQLSDHDVEGNYAWFTMPFYEGTPLDVRLAERFKHGETLSLEEAHEIFQPLAGALAALHASGFRHQDIKPENIFLARFADKEHPILLDLGVAISKDNQTFLAGTREYFAPEQLAAFLGAMGIRPQENPAKLDEKMDVYGLAATLLLAIVGPKLAPGARLLRATSAGLTLDEIWTEIEATQRLREREPVAKKALRALRGPPRDSLIAAFRRWLARDPAARPVAATMARELGVLIAQRAYLEERRRRMTRFAVGAATLLLVGAPIAYVGGRYAVSLKECKDRVATDALKSGQVAATLQDCQVQANGLMQRERECSGGLTHERSERERTEREIGSKLSACTNADAQLRYLVASVQAERDALQTKTKECATALAKSEDSYKAAVTSLETSQADLTKANGDLAKCTTDLGPATAEAIKCDAELGTCKGEVAKKDIEVARSVMDAAKLTLEKSESSAKLATCAGELGACKSSSGACPGALATCTTSLGACLKKGP